MLEPLDAATPGAELLSAQRNFAQAVPTMTTMARKPRMCTSESSLPSFQPLLRHVTGGGDEPCPVCLSAVADTPVLRLACGHTICAPCGETASEYGMMSCPQCRAPHILNLSTLVDRLASHRDDYRSWRMGKQRGAKGEIGLEKLAQPGQTISKDTAVFYRPSVGLIHVSHHKPPKRSLVKPTVDDNITNRPTSPTYKQPAMYDTLIGTSERGSAIIFAWWPSAISWSLKSIIRYATRALVAVRPGVDLAMLPDHETVRSLWSVWVASFGLQQWQIIWYSSPFFDDNDKRTDAEQSRSTFSVMVAALSARWLDVSARLKYHVYPSRLTCEWRSQIRAMGFGCIGDPDDAIPMIGSLCQAKGWLHRPVTRPAADLEEVDGLDSPCRTSLAEALESGKLSIGHARPPLGFICTTADEQHHAYNLLRERGCKVVLKPVDGLGCKGLVLDATQNDLAPKDCGSIHPCIVEEFVGVPNGPSPTVYMCGETVLAIADQLMINGDNVGNVVPSTSSATLQTQMAEAGAAIGRYLGLTSQWGMDFVVDSATGHPIIVDLNMGRPNGSLANYLWRSVQDRPASAETPELHQYAIGRTAPIGESALDFMNLLRDAGLLWKEGCVEGVMPCTHIIDGRAMVLCLSWRGIESARAVASKLYCIDRKGAYAANLRFVVRTT